MSFGLVLEAVLGLARVALASILLVGVPLADAATCGAENPHSAIETVMGSDNAQTLMAVETGDAEHDSQSPDAQHCIHGHCHHSTPFRGSESTAPSIAETSIKTELVNGPVILARVSTGLERPPKA